MFHRQKTYAELIAEERGHAQADLLKIEARVEAARVELITQTAWRDVLVSRVQRLGIALSDELLTSRSSKVSADEVITRAKA